MKKVNNILKLSLTSLVAVKGAFASFSPFLEATVGAYNQSVSSSAEKNSNYTFQPVKSDKKTSPVLSLGAGFAYDFEAPIFVGAKILLQNNGQDLKNKAGTVVSLNGVSASLTGFVGYRMNNFRPYLAFGVDVVKADIKEKTLQYTTGKKSASLGALFVGAGLEYEINKNLTILAEYTQGSGKTKFTKDLPNIPDTVKSEIKYNIKSFKIGARYYFGK